MPRIVGWLRVGASLLCLAPALAPAQEDTGLPFPPPEEAHWRVEGAIGPVVHASPWGRARAGATVSVTPGFFLRIGRVSASNTGAFVVRRSDDVFEGLGADLRIGDTVTNNAGLRIDRGRKQSVADNGEHFDGTPATIRARLTTAWSPKPPSAVAGWRFSLSWTTDILGRHAGQTLDLSANHDEPWSPRTKWSIGANVGASDGRHMRREYGVTPDEAVRTDTPAYQPGGGLRDLTAFTSWRTDLDAHWVMFYGGSVGRLLGPAAGSPLVHRAVHIDVNGGIARRF